MALCIIRMLYNVPSLSPVKGHMCFGCGLGVCASALRTVQDSAPAQHVWPIEEENKAVE